MIIWKKLKVLIIITKINNMLFFAIACEKKNFFFNGSMSILSSIFVNEKHCQINDD